MKYKVPAICVDASCIGNPGQMEYRAVDAKTHKEIFHSPIYPIGTNNIGEYLAIVDAIKLITSSADSHFKCIYSDSQTAIAWVKSRKIKTTLEYSDDTKKLLTQLQEATIWLKTHTWDIPILKRETEIWGEIPADFGRKS